MKFNLASIIIFVQDIENLKPFYIDILQLEIIEDASPGWLLLKAGNCNIGLHKIGAGYIDDNKEQFKFDNNTKIVFEIDEDINLLRTQFLLKNVKIGEVKTFDNYDFHICDGEDPEGNVFQLKQKRAAK
jgi:catechol-2,3-dioxygenase